MSEDPETTLLLAGGIGPAPERTPQPAFVPAERGFRLPPLAIHPAVAGTPRLLPEPLDHLPSVLGLGPLPALPATVQRDDGRPDPEILAAVPVVGFAVERRIGQNPVPGDDQGCLGHRRAELRGIVTRAGGDSGPGEEVTGGIAGNGEFGPEPGGLFPPRSLEEVPGCVTALQPGRIHRGGRLGAD